jgi:hypothetical protein
MQTIELGRRYRIHLSAVVKEKLAMARSQPSLEACPSLARRHPGCPGTPGYQAEAHGFRVSISNLMLPSEPSSVLLSAHSCPSPASFLPPFR